VFWRPEDSLATGLESRTGIVIAGPSSALTIPGIVVSEIVRALAFLGPVTSIEVDVAADFMSGLHRAPSLANAHHLPSDVVRHRAPDNARLRGHAFRDLLTPQVRVAVAYAWPSIDNSWIQQFLQIAERRGVTTVVLCASLPESSRADATSIADILYRADHVLVGEVSDAIKLEKLFGSRGPNIESCPALSLRGKHGRTQDRQISAFLPSDDRTALATILSAFDAIPEAWIDRYQLQVLMRHSNELIPEMISSSYHSEHVRLIGSDLSTNMLEELCFGSSALSVTEPAADSRAFSFAMESGKATVVISDSLVPKVGNGYIGGFLADQRSPSSVNVALNHALRLEELQFPSPDAWETLAKRLNPISVPIQLLEPASND
jgi:hypothetical protein